MNKKYVLPVLLLLACWAKAQDSVLEVSTGKTIAVVFPSTILHVDRGRREVLVQQVSEANNLLLIKAASPTLSETNLSVLTEEGKLYSFLVRYTPTPVKLIYALDQGRIQLKNGTPMESDLSSYATMILDNEKKCCGTKKKKGNVSLELQGIYTLKDVVFFQLVVENNATTDFTVGQVRFFLRNQGEGKRTAVQEKELWPLESWISAQPIAERKRMSMVFALPRQTLLHNEFLGMAMEEKMTGSRLEIKIKNRQLVRAIELPQLSQYERISGPVR